MTPAIECGGCSSFKLKTAHEPANSLEMEGLINAAARHTSDQGYNYAMDLL